MNTPTIQNCLVIQLSGKGCKKMAMPCNTFKEASILSQMYIQANDLGGSTYTGGIIYHHSKGAIAHVSYNGRVWEGKEMFALTRKEITDLSANDITSDFTQRFAAMPPESEWFDMSAEDRQLVYDQFGIDLDDEGDPKYLYGIQISDIKQGAKFKTKTGIVWIIDAIENDRVMTSMEHGKKGNYRDDIKTVVDFLNEENSVKI